MYNLIDHLPSATPFPFGETSAEGLK